MPKDVLGLRSYEGLVPGIGSVQDADFSAAVREISRYRRIGPRVRPRIRKEFTRSTAQMLALFLPFSVARFTCSE